MPPDVAPTPAPNSAAALNSTSAGGIATPSLSNPQGTYHEHATPVDVSPPQFQQHFQYPQNTQQHAMPSQQQPHPQQALNLAHTPAHAPMHAQQAQPAPSGVVLDTHAPQGSQPQRNWAMAPDTAIGATAPDLHGRHAAACIATPPNFNTASRHGGGAGHANSQATPAHLDPPALPCHPQNGAHVADSEPPLAVPSQHGPSSADACGASLQGPWQHFTGGADTQCMGGLQGEGAEDAFTLRLPCLLYTSDAADE